MKGKRWVTVLWTVTLLLVLTVLGCAGYMELVVHNQQRSLQIEQLAVTSGPWSAAGTWVSADGASYLVCRKPDPEGEIQVTAYLYRDGDWQCYTLMFRGRTAYFNSADPEGISYTGTMQVEDDSFAVTRLRAVSGGPKPAVTRYDYSKTNLNFDPDLLPE